MSRAEVGFWTLFIIYYIAVLLWFVINVIIRKRRRKRYFFELAVMVLLPFSGLVISKVSLLAARKNPDAAADYEKFQKTSGRLYEAEVDKAEDMAAIQDILAFNDAKERRSTVLDIFRYDSEKYVRELKIALNDYDTEVSHYASAALIDIKERLENRLIDARLLYEKKQEDKRLAAAYLSMLSQYMESGIADKSGMKKYMEVYCKVMEHFNTETFFDEFLPLYPVYLQCLLSLKMDKKALEFAGNYINAVHTQEAYMAVLKAYYSLKEGERFCECIERLRCEDFILSDENYECLQYYLEEGAR